MDSSKPNMAAPSSVEAAPAPVSAEDAVCEQRAPFPSGTEAAVIKAHQHHGPCGATWRHVLPSLRHPGSSVDVASLYVQRRFTAREVAAKEFLQHVLAPYEGLKVTVAGLLGPASEANGDYKACQKLVEGRSLFTKLDGSSFCYCVGRARWCLSPVPGATAGTWAEVASAAWVPPPGRWTASPPHASAEVQVSTSSTRLLSRFLSEVSSTVVEGEERLLAIRQLHGLPRLLARVCREAGVSVLELQKVLLPAWGINASYASKEACFEALGAGAVDLDCIGELAGLSIHQEGAGMGERRHSNARWVELLDGTTHARFITDAGVIHASPTFLADPPMNAALLRGLRQLQWSHDLHWAFPKRHCAYMESLMELLLAVGFRSLDFWARSVLPFLGDVFAEGAPLLAAGHVGQDMELYYAGEDRWLPCKVVRVEPISGAMQVSVTRGLWLTPSSQAHSLRVPGA